VDPVPDPLLFFSGSAGNRTRASGSVERREQKLQCEVKPWKGGGGFPTVHEKGRVRSRTPSSGPNLNSYSKSYDPTILFHKNLSLNERCNSAANAGFLEHCPLGPHGPLKCDLRLIKPGPTVNEHKWYPEREHCLRHKASLYYSTEIAIAPGRVARCSLQ
jgi:hypothetical protein